MQLRLRHLLQIAMMAVIICVMGLLPPIPVGFIPVPIILQNMGIMLAGALLGGRRGLLAVLVVMLLGICGIPGGVSPLTVLVSPTGGYIMAYPLAALLIGVTVHHFGVMTTFWRQLLLVMLCGVLLIDGLGTLWLAHISHMALGKAIVANLVFWPGDTLTAIGTVIITHICSRTQRLQDLFQ